MATRTVSASANLLAPLPVLLSGLLPFWAGTLLAMVSGYPLRTRVLLYGSLEVALLVLAAFAAREIYAPGAGRYPAWRLAPLPGSRLTDKKRNPNRIVFYIWLGLAAAWALDLQFFYRTGDLTIPLGALGVLGGYFSFAPPLAWHRRGLGEIFGALCFGLLPVVTGFYLQSGYWVAEELFYGLPLTLAGFNLFLIYGMPEPGEETPSRLSLAARLGPVPAALVYTLANVLVILLLVALLLFPASPLPLRDAIWLLLALAVVNQELVKRRAYREEARLRLLCRLSLVLHLGMGAIFCLMLWQRL